MQESPKHFYGIFISSIPNPRRYPYNHSIKCPVPKVVRKDFLLTLGSTWVTYPCGTTAHFILCFVCEIAPLLSLTVQEEEEEEEEEANSVFVLA
jgi:hypothetical protein